jgi:hypothetical protein
MHINQVKPTGLLLKCLLNQARQAFQPFIKIKSKTILINSFASLFLRRRDGRAVECGGLENR